MGAKQILEQEEIDALLDVKDKNDKNVAEYDFTNDKIVRGRLPTLELIKEKFARSAKVEIFNSLRINPDIQFQEVKVSKYNEYVSTLYLPSNINIVKLKPFDRQILVILDSKLVFLLVDIFYGGDGKNKSKNKLLEFTVVEYSFLKKLLKIMFEKLEEAWKPVYPVKYIHESFEINPQMVDIINPNEYLVITKFKVEHENGFGEMHIAYPNHVIEPIKDVLSSSVQSDTVGDNEKWNKIFKSEVDKLNLNLKACLASKKTTIQKVLKFKVGQIIDIDCPDLVTVSSSGVPIFNGNLGQNNGKYAIKVSNMLSSFEKGGESND